MKYLVLGYGAGKIPLTKGVFLCESDDKNYAADIADAMAKKHVGQWFGVSLSDEVECRVIHTEPIRYALETSK